jgi:hypothetical protein
MQLQNRIVHHPAFLAIIYAVLTLFISIRAYNAPGGEMPGFEGRVTAYNNYLIFSNSFGHLLEGKNLYSQYPSEQYDVFKYSPTFAMLFAPIAALPHGVGLSVWNLLNALVFLYAIKKLSLPPIRELGFGLLAIPEIFTTTSNSQSNLLIAGLLILAFVNLERGKIFLPILFISLTVYIKLFGVLFFALVLLYPQRLKMILTSCAVMFMLFILPIPFGGWERFFQHYKEYFGLLSGDHGYFVKYSVMGWFKSWFNWQPNKNSIVIIGLLIQCFPLLLRNHFDNRLFRTYYAASWLIWLVIFNHMAESATFIIAVAGIFLWYFSLPERKPWHIVVLAPVMLFTCLGPSDLYPKMWRMLIVETWQMKVFPCMVIWLICLAQLILPALKKTVSSTQTPAAP